MPDRSISISSRRSSSVSQGINAALVEARRFRQRAKLPSELPWYCVVGSAPPITSATLKSMASDNELKTIVEIPMDGALCIISMSEEALFLRLDPIEADSEASTPDQLANWKFVIESIYECRRPFGLNAMIVVLDVASVMKNVEGSEPTLMSNILGIMRCVKDWLPLYLVVPDCNRLVGFDEVFGELSEAECPTVWGAAIPMGAPGVAQPDDMVTFDERLKRIPLALRELTASAIGNKVTSDECQVAYCFPGQFERLLVATLSMIDTLTSLRNSPMPIRLRGVYFGACSEPSAQLDLIGSELLPAFGAHVSILPSTKAVKMTRFLRHFCRDVLLPEQALVSYHPNDGTASRNIRKLAGLAAVLLSFGIAIFCTWSFLNENQALIEFQGKLRSYIDLAKVEPSQDVSNSDLQPIFRVLAAIDNLETSGPRVSSFWPFDFSTQLKGELSDLQRRVLNLLVLPRILIKIQQSIEANRPSGGPQVANLKMYLALGGKLPVENGALLTDLTKFMNQAWAGIGDPQQREALIRAVTIMLKDPLVSISLDPVMLDRAVRAGLISE